MKLNHFNADALGEQLLSAQRITHRAIQIYVDSAQEVAGIFNDSPRDSPGLVAL